MKDEFLIAPSILSADFANLGQEMDSVTRAGADYIHVDVMDGHFVPNLTIGAPVVEGLKKYARIPLDCHLMITEPEKYIEDFARAGASIITVHFEVAADVAVLGQKIRALGIKSGLSIKPNTPAAQIFPLLKEFDLILVMTVEPGFSGQKFMPDSAAKLAQLRAEIDRQKLNVLLEVDGGINAETARECLDADILVAGHAVFRSGNYDDAIARLKNAKRSVKK